jgi:hypothetical protein
MMKKFYVFPQTYWIFGRIPNAPASPARNRRRLWVCLCLLAAGCTRDGGMTVTDPTPNPCTGFPAPSVFSSGAAGVGDTVSLFALTNVEEVSFEWTGPAGFAATVQNPVLAGVQYAMNGTYAARISNASCTSLYASTTVTVDPPCAPMALNTASVGGVNWYFYSNVTCGPLGANLFHGMTATCPYGTLYVQFNRITEPEGYAVYGVDPLPGIDTTLVSLRVRDGGTDFDAVGGDAYVGRAGDSTWVSFCGLTFRSSGGVTRTVSARLACH